MGYSHGDLGPKRNLAGAQRRLFCSNESTDNRLASAYNCPSSPAVGAAALVELIVGTLDIESLLCLIEKLIIQFALAYRSLIGIARRDESLYRVVSVTLGCLVHSGKASLSRTHIPRIA